MKPQSKILVIDDEIGICEGIRRALTPQGYYVDFALNGEEGLGKIRKDGFEIVLLDIMMPGVSGVTLIKGIHDVDPEIVCIIITGYATVELAVRSIKEGAYDFLTKPFSVDDLTHAVDQGLERHRLSFEARRVQSAELESRRLKEEKARLEELDRAKKQFIRLVTHELQAPIDDIQSYLTLIQEGFVAPDRMDEIILRCKARAEEERALIGDLLELGHLETSRLQQSTSEVQLDNTLTEVIEPLQAQAEMHKIRFMQDVQSGIPSIHADAGQLKSLWRNLLDNAIKYTPDNGSVTISLFVKEGAIHGQVTDTGIGIAQEDQDRIFTEFFRARNAKELGVRGTGLGLVIVRRIVEGLGGTVSVSSKLGQGSTFSFEIPVLAEPGKV